MIRREIAPFLLRAFRKYPVVTLTGPRQSGKSTLCRALFGGKPYANLEDPEQRRFASEDPKGFLRQFRRGAVIDEVQRVPELASAIQVVVDEKGGSGLFVLTGSQQLELSMTISQSLAGRTAVFRLLPFGLSELMRAGRGIGSADELIHRGFYPRIHDHKLDPYEAMGDYVETYLERDVRSLTQVRDLAAFQRFVRICAGRSGQLVNFQSMAADAGVSNPTASAWLSTLRASFVVFLLEPFHRNFNKRLVKAPKLYFYDTALVCYLLRIRSPDQLASHPLRGALFENLVVAEALKAKHHRKLPLDLSFYRDKEGHEVDLVLEDGRALHAVEAKSGGTYHPDLARGLRYFAAKVPGGSTRLTLVHDRDSDRAAESKGVEVTSPRGFARLLARLR